MENDRGVSANQAGYGSALHSEVEDLLYRAPVGLMTIQFDGTVVAHNRMLCQWLGLPDPTELGQLVGVNAFEWLNAESQADVEAVISSEIASSGKLREFMITCQNFSGEEASAIVNADLVMSHAGEPRLHIAMIDASDRVRFEQQLEAARAAADEANERLTIMQEGLRHGALHDSLTGLPNKALLEEQLRRVLGSATRTGRSCAILFLDLDHFRQFNAEAGYSVGDTVIAEVARRLREVCQDNEIVSRVAGDEFVVVVSATTSEEIDELCARIHQAVSVPMPIDVQNSVITTSIGGVIWQPQEGEGAPHARQLFVRADRAIYDAKCRGRNTTVLVSWSCTEE